METTTLPIFRVAGWGKTAPRSQAQNTAEMLKQRFQAAEPELAAFSKTLYVVYQYLDDENVKVVAGKLVATDFALPENVDDVWVAPQNYALFSSWQEMEIQPDLSRNFRVDFETYPTWGAPKIYVGVVGDVEMHEDTFDE